MSRRPMDDDVLEYVTIGQQATLQCQQQQAQGAQALSAPLAPLTATQAGLPRLVQRQAVHQGAGVGEGAGSTVFGQGLLPHQQGPESSNMMSTDNVIAFAPGIEIDVSGV